MKNLRIKELLKNAYGKNILITGATGGLGFALTKQFLQAGANVTATARNNKKALELKQSISGHLFETLCLDLQDMQSCNNFIDSCQGKSFDILINNAGVYDISPKVTAYGVNVHLVVNFVNTLYITQGIAKNVEKVVFVTSLAAGHYKKATTFKSCSRFEMYAKSKMLCALAALQYAKDNLNIKIVFAHPGISATQIVKSNAFLRVIVANLMKVVFPSPRAGSQAIIAAALSEIDGNFLFGPCVFKIWGRPKLYKNYAQILDSQNQLIAFEYYKKLLNQIKNGKA